jgi:DNA-binding SARP family transcriptional activator
VAHRASPRASADRLVVDLIGGASFSWRGRLIEIRAAKGRALLAALTLSDGGTLAREQAADMLWPGAETDRRRLSLRQTLKAVNDSLAGVGCDAFEAGRVALSLDLGRVTLDLDLLGACADQGVVHPILRAGGDPFAEVGAGLEAGAAFSEWLAKRISMRRAAMRSTLERALDVAPDAAHARDLALALRALDPAAEAPARRLIGAYADLGEPQKALEAYDALWRALDARGGGEPSAETQAAIAPLLTGGSRRGPDPRPEASAPRLTVAVRPFEAERADRRDGAWSLEALRLALAAALSRFDAWRVALDHRDDADYVLRGALVGEAGRSVLIATLETWPERRLVSAQRALVASLEAAHGAAQAADVFASALYRDAQARIGAPGDGRGALGDAATPPALRPMRARALAESLRPSALQRALELSSEPDERRGAAAARSAVLSAALDGRPPSAAELAGALDSAERAVDADPLSPEARLALGWCLLMERRFDAAAEEFALAAHLNPASAPLQREAAFGLALAGRGAEARGLGACADALDPDRADGAGFLPGMTAFALGERHPPLPDDPHAPATVRAWRAAALAEAGETVAAARAIRPLAWGGALAEDAIVRALPLRAPERVAALRRNLAAARAASQDSAADLSRRER